MPAYPSVGYGLLGRKLSHSWSPRIHASLGSAPYYLVELEPSDVVPYIHEGSWRGLNVTIPYKRIAAETADVRSPRVEALGVANTLVHLPDGRVLADNTDVLGFAAMLEAFCTSQLGRPARDLFAGRKALVLGTGGAAQAVAHALRETAGAEVAFVSRTGALTYDNVFDLQGDAALIVNATPVGMYPNCPASPLPDGALERFPQLLAVLDVIYNPVRTGLCLQAEKASIPFESGLPMLVWQALRASELFQQRRLDEGLVDTIVSELTLSTGNIALIGMPGAGKTTTGRILARITGRPFVDLDDVFVLRYGTSAAACIINEGEPAFRDKETELLASYASDSGIVMACGGGVVTRPANYDLLHQNSVIVMLDRPIGELTSAGRPLSRERGVEILARERMGLYRGWADLIVPCSGSAADDAAQIRASLSLPTA